MPLESKQSAEKILFELFQDDSNLGAVLVFIEEHLHAQKLRLNHQGSTGFYEKAAELIGVNAAIMALNSLDNEFRTLRERILSQTNSPSDDEG